MSERRVTLNIDRLVLRGIDPMDQRALAEGLKNELARVLAEPATRAAIGGSRSTPVIRLSRVPMQQGQAGARALGAGVAKAIVRGIKP